MINPQQLQDFVIIPALDALGMKSEAAINLLLGTCAQESAMGEYLVQIKGPAQGIFQMEPVTFRDIWANYVSYRPKIENILRDEFRGRANNSSQMVSDLRYATAMARLHYRRVKEPLPAADDVWGLAEYWKQHYNTPLGRGTVQEFVHNFEHYVMENLE